MRRLLELAAAGQLTSAHVRLAAASVGAAERTVWRWLDRARSTGMVAGKPRDRLVVDDELRRRLAYWRGNVSALHREMVAAAAAGGAAAPSLATLQRAVARDLSPGARAGLRKGEPVIGAFELFRRRPAAYRNAAWAVDQLEAPVEVTVDGRLVRPWITWFVDCASNAVCGTVVTAGPPGRESILAALRAAVSADEPYGPPGGLPEKVLVQPGKGALSDVVGAALGVFAVAVQDLPGSPAESSQAAVTSTFVAELEGPAGSSHGAVTSMFVAELEGPAEALRVAVASLFVADGPAVTFEAFVVTLLDWVRWWNTDHRLDDLGGRTPVEAWLADPTPLSTVPAEDLRLFTLPDDGRRRKITNAGLRWRRRRYLGSWMNGQVGRPVRVRWMPHHDQEIEVFDAVTGAHLGAASLASPAEREPARAVRRPRVGLPDPGPANTLDALVERLRVLKFWAGDPSYESIKDRVNAEWTAAGRPVGELVGKTTVVDCFRLGRRRLNTDLFVAVVQALHPDVGYVAQWRQALQVIGAASTAAAQVRVQNSLPPDLAGFTGRAAELDRLAQVLGEGGRAGGAVVISAIEGMAGVGKTQLAVHAGHLLVRQGRVDRVLFVNLRGFHPEPAQPPAEPAAVLDGFLRLLAVPGPEIPYELEARTAAFRGLLAGTRTLVVLDNAADADQVRPLLPQTPGCPVLVTSRRTLSDLNPAAHLSVDVFTPAEARQFLTQAAPEVAAGGDPEAAVRIAGRCGYLPLALGLLAGHMRAKPGWTLTDHADWLDERHRDRRLDTGIELALDLSYQHLSADRRQILRLLALHPGQDLDAYAAAALADTDLATARAHLHRLCGDHLLQPGTPGRYIFHDLVRAYAVTKAHDEDRPPARRAALTRLFDHYLATAATAMDTLHPAEVQLRPRIPAAATPAPELTDPDVALAWLDTERPALVAVAGHTAAHGWPTHTTRLARTLFRYLDGGHLTDAMTVHGHAHRAARDSGDPLGQAHALTDLSVAHGRLGRYGPAAEHLQQALALLRQAGDEAGQARILNNLGTIAIQSGRYRTATDHYTQALALHRLAGNQTRESTTLANLGVVEGRLGRYQSAIEHFEQALAVCRRTGDRTSEAETLDSLGHVELRSGRLGPAGEHLRLALSLFRQLGNRTGEAGVLDSLGLLHTRLGQPDLATEYHQQALTFFRETGDQDNEVWVRNGLGEAAQAAGQPATALSQHGAAHAIAAEIGDLEEQARAHTGLGNAYRSLGDPALAREHYEHALTLYADLEMPEAEAIRAQLGSVDIPGQSSSS